MKVYIIVKETRKEVDMDMYWEHENIEVFSSKQDAEFELKYTYRSEGFKEDVCFSIEEMELV